MSVSITKFKFNIYCGYSEVARAMERREIPHVKVRNLLLQKNVIFDYKS